MTAKASSRNLVVRRQIVRAVEIDLIDLRLRHEGLDVDQLGALDLERLQVLVLDDDVLALADLDSP